jgi:hypothetical protein
MGTAVKGGQWCMTCEKPVAGQKTTHRARGAAGIATGLWPLAIGDGYHCPGCGGPVTPDLGPGRRPVLDADGRVAFPSTPSVAQRFAGDQIALRVIIACIIVVVLLTKI